MDIIIPVYNEEKLLREEEEYFRDLGKRATILFVDGGSSDETAKIAERYGRVIPSPKGRASQKNRGARESKADRLLFLHADCRIDFRALETIERAMRDGAAGGCLTMSISGSNPLFRAVEVLVNMRARAFKVLDGDLGQFVRREAFDRTGGFDPVDRMEDVLFGRKLKRTGPVRILADRIRVSPRKWYADGFRRTFGSYAAAYLGMWGKALR